jgi:signal transduction histidine kinase
MKINTALRIAVFIVIIGFISFVGFSTSAFIEINKARLNSIHANQVVADVGNLRGLTLEYLHFPSTRVIDQIFRQQKRLSNNLSLISPNPEETLLISELLEDDAHLDYLFEQLVAASESGNENLENLLAGQIAVTSEKIVTRAIKLSDSSEDNILTTLRYAYYSTVIFAAALFGLILFIVYFFKKGVVRPLIELEKGTKAIAIGDLNYKVPVKDRSEIGILADSFNRMSDKLKEVDEIKTQFLNTAAHQLRTPISAIRWNTEALLKEKEGFSNKTAGKVDQIYQSTIYMIEIVGELLSVSRLTEARQADKPKEVDFNQLIQNILKDMEHEINQKKLEVKTKTPTTGLVLHIDPIKFSTVITNLVSNAVNYTENRGKISITASETPNQINIAVSDTGIGIPKNERPGVFSKFYRASNAVSVKPNGSGLGLFISKSYASDWGGELTFSSIEGKGTTFNLRLPKSFKKV